MTTDADRANAWLVDWIDWLPASERDAFLASLTELFAAVRLDERRAVVRYLENSLASLADAVWREEHLA